MSDHPQPEHLPAGGTPPDPTAPPPVSGQPWDAPTGDVSSGGPTRAAGPPSYLPGYAAVPERDRADHPPTSAFPTVHPTPEAVNYAPPGYTPDYGHPTYPEAGQPPYPGAGHPPYGAGFPLPGYGPPEHGGYPGADYTRSGYPGSYPPPGYGPPPGPPPRRSNAPLIAVIVAVALLLCGGAATAGILAARTVADRAAVAVKPTAPQLPTAVPHLPTQPPDRPGVPGSTDQTGQTITVTYEVQGDGPAEIVYLGKLDAGPSRVDDVSLPWKFTTTLQAPTLVSVIAMRIDPTAEGEVTCRALVNGREVKKSTAHGTVATAACTYFALD